MAQQWLIFVKIGDESPDDIGLKDGEIVFYRPATGWVGTGDMSSYAVLYIVADQAEIQRLTAAPPENSAAYTAGRRVNYYLPIDEIFGAEEAATYRDDQTRVGVVSHISLGDFACYSDRPEALARPFLHGSISSGTYTIGDAGDYASINTFFAAITSDEITSDLEGVVISDTSMTGTIYVAPKTTSADATIIIRGQNPNLGMESYRVTAISDIQVIRHSKAANTTLCDLHFAGVTSSFYETATTETVRTVNVYNMVFSPASFVFGWAAIELIANSNPPPATKFNMYNIILYMGPSGGYYASNAMYFSGRYYTTAQFDANIKAENISMFSYFANIAATTYCIYYSYSSAGQTLTLRNIAMYARNPLNFPAVLLNLHSAGNLLLKNCARNGALVDQGAGAIIESDCITNLASGDFLSTDPSDPDFAKIDSTSRLFQAGATRVITGSTTDVYGDGWLDPPAIGAVQGEPPLSHVSALLGATGFGALDPYISFVPDYGSRVEDTTKRAEISTLSGRVFRYNFSSIVNHKILLTRQITEAMGNAISAWAQSGATLDYYPVDSATAIPVVITQGTFPHKKISYALSDTPYYDGYLELREV